MTAAVTLEAVAYQSTRRALRPVRDLSRGQGAPTLPLETGMLMDPDLLPSPPKGEQWPLELVEAAIETTGMTREEVMQWANDAGVLPFLPDDFRAGEGERPAK